ncbi:MAG: DUF177 domain-containing protein [Chthonomonadales bacterium]|nr:DUF177 domain-containing protein [Chthonomonadales bacterium]
MQLDLSEILARVGVRRNCEVLEPPIVDCDLVCNAPIEGELWFSNAGSALLVTGHATTRVALVCSRCLAAMDELLEVAIDEQYPLVHRTGGGPGHRHDLVVDEDENLASGRLFAGPLLDLTELLRQTLSVALPLQPLHRPDCAGLCRTCGQDLNDGPCNCRSTDPDERLAPLAKLLEQRSVDRSPHTRETNSRG